MSIEKCSLLLNIAFLILCISIEKKLTTNEVVQLLDNLLQIHVIEAKPYS